MLGLVSLDQTFILFCKFTHLIKFLNLTSMHDHNITVFQDDFEYILLCSPCISMLVFITSTNGVLGLWSPMHGGTATKGYRCNRWTKCLFAIVMILLL
jgi:hypothetical protein